MFNRYLKHLPYTSDDARTSKRLFSTPMAMTWPPLDPTIQLFLLLFTITRYYRGKMVLEVILISGRLDINYQLNTLETQCS